MAAGKPKKDPPPLPADEGRKVRAFQQRAAPILAMHGGVNADSQVKLRALATELGLSEEEFLAAVSGSAGAGAAHPALTPEQIESVARFSKNIVRSLRKQRRDVLTPQVEAKLVEAGQGRYRLPAEVARSTVRRVAAENGIRAISKAEARQYIADLVRQRAGDGQWIDHALRQRAYSEGKQWGLSRDEVSSLLSGYLTTARRRTWLERVMLGLAMLAVFAVGGLLAWIVLPRGTIESLTGAPAPSGPEEAPPEPVGPDSVPPPDAPSNQWWDVDLAVAIGRAHKSLPDFAPVLADLQSSDEAKRGAAYEAVLHRAAGVLDDQLAPRVLREIVVGCYALDPADKAAGQIREALLAGIPKSGSDLPEAETGYRPLLWTLGTAVAALKREGLPAARGDALAVALGQAVGAAVDRTQESGAITHQCVTALFARLYRLMAALAAAEPALSHDRYKALSDLAATFLNGAAKLRLDADVLAALLPRSGGRWREYKPLVQECVASAETSNVLKMVDVYERATDPELQGILRDMLAQRCGVRAEGANPADAAQAMREALGASLDPASRTGADRWRLLAVRAHRAIGEASAEAAPPEKLLEQSVRLAGLATLAFALSRRELGYVTYDQLSPAVFDWKPPVRARDPASKPSGPLRGPPVSFGSPAALGEVYSLCMSLKAFRRMDPDRRLFVIASLRRYAGQLSDVTPEQGAIIAEYLLSSKTEVEYRKVANHLEDLGRWRSVRLGLADEMNSAPLPKERAVEVVSEVLRRKIDLAGEENWKTALRYLLLKDVLDDLPRDEAGRGSPLGPLCDAASEAIQEYQAAEAQLLGIPPEEYKAAASPAARLRMVIDRFAAELSKRGLRDQDRAWLAEMPHELAAADYLGTSDLARSVLLGRIWLRLAAAHVAQQAPDRAAGADRIVAALARSDAQAPNLLMQLRDGERAALEVWLLLSEAK